MKKSFECSKVALMSALANEKRILIFKCILDKEVAVSELAEMVGLSQSALSQHLAKLRRLKLVDTRRDAQTIYYTSENEGVRRVLATLSEVFDRHQFGLKQAS